MGNGRWSEESSEKSVGWWACVFGAIFVLLLAGAVLLGWGSRRNAQMASAQAPVAPMIPTSARPSQHAKPDARAILGQLPLIFEPNQGQADPTVKFLSQGAGYSLLLDATGALLGLQTAQSSLPGRSQPFVRMKLVGANPAAATTGTNPLPGKSNYLIGNDPKKWHSGIPQFAGVQYKNIYPGIDLVFYGNQGHLEYDLRVAPGADPSRAELQFDGAAKMRLSGGDLILTDKDDGGLRLQAPQIYQLDGDRQKQVEGRFVLRAPNRVAFEIGSYDHSRELVIDPLLSFSTYFGGSGSETSPSIAVNGDGNIYLVGTTQGSPATSFTDASSTTQTLIGPLSLSSTSPSHIFVAKINPSLPPTVAYETFIGGSGSDTSVGLGVDNGGNAYIVGNTTSPDFPTIGFPYQTGPETKGTQCASIACTSVSVSVLSSTGSSLTYSSYLSGNGNDQANGMTIDSNRDVFIVGNTTSNDTPSLTDAFPATQFPAPFQNAPASSLQFFVTKVNTGIPGTGSIAYSTYFGGSSPVPATAVGGGIAVDAAGNIYFSGTTNFYNSGSGVYGNSGPSGDFPILNAYQPCLDTIPPTTLNPANACSPPATPYATDAFLAKINPNGQAGDQLLFSTFLGGTGADSSTGLAIDSGAANIYLTGSTNSTGFVLPTGSAAFETCLNNSNPAGSTAACTTANTSDTDAYVARFSNPAASTTGTPVDVALTYFSYLGGSGNDSGLAIAVDTASDALVTGTTNSTNFPVTAGPIQSTLNGTQNAFYAQIDTTTSTGQNGLGSYVTYFGGNGIDRGTSIALDPVSQATYFAGDTTSGNVNGLGTLPTVDALQTTLQGPSDAFVVKLGSAPDVCITCVAPTISPTGVVPAGIAVAITFTVTNQGPEVATGITVTGAVSATGVTFGTATAGSGSCSAAVSNSVVCTIPTLQVGSTSAVTFNVTPTVVGTFEATATVLKINNSNTDIVATAGFTASDYSVIVSPSGQMVGAGGIAAYNVQLYPTNVFNGTVALTCDSLPSATTCNFVNSSLNLQNGNTSTTLNLQTTPQPVATVASAPWRHPLYALWLMIPGMALLGLGAGGKGRRSRRLLGWLALSVFFALVLLQPSCSGSKPTPPPSGGTPSGTYSLTVTATSGSFTKSAPFQLTVNP